MFSHARRNNIHAFVPLYELSYWISLNSVRDELGVNIVLPQALNSLYKGYMQGVNEINAEEVLSALNNMIPDIALKLTLQQAAGSGHLVCHYRSCTFKI